MPSGHTPRSLSARTHKDADEEVSARSRRIVVKSLAAGRQIRGGSVWSCPQPIAGPLPPPSPRRRPGTAALGNAPGDVSSELPAPVTLCVGPKQLTAPRHDVRGERPMSLFNSPARAHMFFRQSTSRDALMTGSLMAPQGSVLSSRPHASHTLPRRLPSMQSDETASFPGADPSTPRQRLFAHAGSESSEDEAGLHGVNSAHSTADVGRSLSGGGSNELWSLSGSDDESIATHRPSTASLAQGNGLLLSRGRRQPSGASQSRPTSKWSQGDKKLSWSLNLTNIGLSTFPEYLFERANLRDLQLTNNNITELPRDIMRLEYLFALKLDDNNLTGLPPALAHLNCLKILYVSNNEISELDEGLSLPPNLVEARFSNNKIRVLPKNLFMSSKFLQVFDFSSNLLVKLPACQWSKDLPNLESFLLKDNRLRTLPASILGMPNLSHLDVSDNKLSVLGVSERKSAVDDEESEESMDNFTFSPKLLSIECKDNASLCFPPPEMIAAGGAKVVQFLRKTVKFRKAENMKKKLAVLNSQLERASQVFAASDPAPAGETHGPHALSSPQPLRRLDTDDEKILSDKNQEEVKNLQTALQEALRTRGVEDLEQNTTMRLIATGTDDDQVNDLLRLISAECTPTTTKGRVCSHGRWEIGGKEDNPVSLKVLKLHGSLLRTRQRNDKFGWSSQHTAHVSNDTSQSKFEQFQLKKLFQIRRAVFLLAWRVFPGEDQATRANQEIVSVSQMMHAIKDNVPHARIFVVPTVTSETDLKSKHVQDLCQRLKKEISKEGKHLHFCGGVHDLAICTLTDYIQQDGMHELKRTLHACVVSSPFYNELLPTYVFNLRERMMNLQDEAGKRVVTWNEFKHHAQKSGVPAGEDAILFVVEMLQELGDLKYFGEGPILATDLRVGATDSGVSGVSKCSRLLANTFFIDMGWLVEVVDQVVGADTTKMITYFADRDPVLAFLASEFVSEGILHPRLVPFIWPSLNEKEVWPGVDPASVVCYWDENKGNGKSVDTVTIGTDKASLEYAYAACVGLNFALNVEDATHDADQHRGPSRWSPAVCRGSRTIRNQSPGLVISPHTIALRKFNMKYGPEFSELGDSLDQQDYLQPIAIPRLAYKSKWHDDTHLATGESPSKCQIFRVRLPEENTSNTLAVYESIKVSKKPELAAVAQSPLAIGTFCRSQSISTANTTTKTSVYHFQPQNPVYTQHKIGNRMVDTHLTRSVRVSLKRREKDPTFHVGFAALLSLPSSEPGFNEGNRYWEALEHIPTGMLDGASLYIEHIIVLYRVSAVCHSIGDVPVATGSMTKLMFETKFAKLIDQRIEFERHLAYMLLSDEEGVGHLKSLALGHSPSDFVKSIKALYENLRVPEMAKAIGPSISKIGKVIEKLDGYLISLDISHNPSLKGIPVQELCKIKSLGFIECVSTPQVYGLPPEVAKLGGASALDYLRSTTEGSVESMELQIIVIGNGEAGKSSLINCITNAHNKSELIHEDARTVGIDIREWTPEPFEIDGFQVNPDKLKCSFLDLAGQAVYGCSNQFFLVPRALYVIAWRVLKPNKGGREADDLVTRKELEKMITHWMDSLQVRVPGASIVMVATHIDTVAGDDGVMSEKSWAEVKKQCEFVKQIVHTKLNQIRLEAAAAGVASLEVHQNGESVKLNCLEGIGVPELRRTLIEMAHKLPWWKELIPTGYYHLKQKIDALRGNKQGPEVWLTWAVYKDLAVSCGITGNHIGIATSFLNDMAVIKYFGQLNAKGDGPDDPNDILDTTVFISPAWIIDGLKGLIRHDREILMKYFQSGAYTPSTGGTDQKTMLRHVNRLATFGICDERLIPFLWPNGGEQGKSYWKWLQDMKIGQELRLWPGLTSENAHPFATKEDDYTRALALLAGCDFVFEQRDKNGNKEYIAPVLLAQDGKLDARSYFEDDCPIRHEYTITGMAPGFFNRLLVRVRQPYSHVENSKNVGVFYGRGLKALLFLVGDGDVPIDSSATTGTAGGVSQLSIMKRANKNKKVPAASRLLTDKSASFDVSADARQNSSKLTVLTSTRKQQHLIAHQLKDLHQFFPGMSIGPFANQALLDADIEAASKEPVHVRIVSLNPDNAANIKRLLADLDEKTKLKGALPLRIDAGNWDEGRGVGEEANMEKYMDVATRVVLVCMESMDLAKWEVERVADLRHKLNQYEKEYRCHGEILDSTITDFIKSHRFIVPDSKEVFQKCGHIKGFAGILKHDPSARECSHNRARTQKEYPCILCISDTAFNLVAKCDFKRAEELLKQAIYLREIRQHGSERPMMFWTRHHKDFIHAIRDKVDQERRMFQNSDPENANKILTDELEVLQQIEIAEKICCKMNQEAESFSKLNPSIDSSQTHRKTEFKQGVSKETFKDSVEKLAYYQQKYFLLWTRLDLLQMRRRIASHKPALKKLIIQLRVLKYGISDMRRAHDAQKGNRQKAEELEEDEGTKVKQLECVTELQAKAQLLDADLDQQIDWMVYYDEFDWHVRKQRPIIPLIMPGYFEKMKEINGRVDYNQWWPKEMDAMKEHALFINLSSSVNFLVSTPTFTGKKSKETRHRGQDVSSIGMEKTCPEIKKLLHQVEKYLSNWRGQAPDPSLFEPPDTIPCYVCVQKRVENPHKFTRKECDEEMAKWVSERQAKNLQNLLRGENDDSDDDDDDELEASLMMACGVDAEHKPSARELLSTASIFDAVPCPRCVKSNDLPPHTWSRKKCAEWFSDRNTQKEGHLVCPKCTDKHRSGNLKILDVIVPQVFFSYNWGKRTKGEDGREVYSTQQSVLPLRNRIELSSDLLVWLDVGGGMGFGESHLTAMLEGIKNATVVIIFISDAYVNSPNCQREYLHAVRHHKFIVPVLVPPDTTRVKDATTDPASDSYAPNAGWTGRYDNSTGKFWWRHIYEVIQKQPDGFLGPKKYDPDNPRKIIDWSLLGSFKPLDMREVLKTRVEASPEEDALLNKIMSRFHRGDHIDHTTERTYATWKQRGNELAILLRRFKSDDVGSLSITKVQSVFEEIDTDNSGLLDAEEMQSFFSKCGAQIDLELAQSLLREADDDRSGALDVHEFMGVITELMIVKEREHESKKENMFSPR